MRAALPVPCTLWRAAQVTSLAALLLVGACRSQAWYDARSACEAQATEQAETAQVDPDQQASWHERAVMACMQAKGVSNPDALTK